MGGARRSGATKSVSQGRGYSEGLIALDLELQERKQVGDEAERAGQSRKERGTHSRVLRGTWHQTEWVDELEFGG